MTPRLCVTTLALAAILPLPLASAQMGTAAPTPLSQAEKEGFRDAVAACWVAPDAAATVTIGFAMGADGMPDADSFRQIGDLGASQSAFAAAKRAVMRCAGDGYDLPAAKYDQWSQLEMRFAPDAPGVPE